MNPQYAAVLSIQTAEQREPLQEIQLHEISAIRPSIITLVSSILYIFPRDSNLLYPRPLSSLASMFLQIVNA